MVSLLAGLLVFLGAHSVSIVAPAWRDRMAASVGVGPWKALYSLVSIAGFVLIIIGYAAARAEPVLLYVPPAGLRHLAGLLPVVLPCAQAFVDVLDGLVVAHLAGVVVHQPVD